jgi:hypothetical protein
MLVMMAAGPAATDSGAEIVGIASDGRSGEGGTVANYPRIRNAKRLPLIERLLVQQKQQSEATAGNTRYVGE